MPTQRPCRRRNLSFESLENRRVLANLAVDIRFLANDQMTRLTRPVMVGERFFVEIAVQDQRGPGETTAGVIGLPLNISWNPAAVQLVGADQLSQTGSTVLAPTNPLVTPSFPLFRSVAEFDPAAVEFRGPQGADGLDDFNLRTLRGAALPNLPGSGSAIGVTTPQRFSLFEFVATGVDAAMQLTVNLDGSMSFADADVLDDVVPVAGTGTVDVPSLPLTVEATIPIISGSIIVHKFNDLNGDGIRQTGEPGLEGVPILLTPGDGSATRTLTTLADGNIRFDNLSAGAYSLSEMTPTNQMITVPDNNRIDVALSGDNPISDGNLFGNFIFVTITGEKFEDLADFGVRNGVEPLIAGVSIVLDLNSDGATTADRTTTTNAQGRYTFDRVPPGTHTIREVVPVGFTQTFPTPVPPGTYTVTPTSGEVIAGRDFGNRRIQEFSPISGSKFNDLNGNGVRDTGEPGLANVTITLNLNNDGGVAERTAMTNADGVFVFEDVPAGTHAINEVIPNGFESTTPLPIIVTVVPPTPITGILIGNFQQPNISGIKRIDTNRDGIGDDPHPGVTIQLDLNNDGSIDRTAVTGADGRYSIERIPRGTHRITEVVPAGFVNPGVPAQYIFTIPATIPLDAFDFINTPIVPTNNNSISGFVYNDTNFNGIFDTGELPLPGRTVVLIGIASAPTTVTTDATGRYIFNNVVNDNYSIRKLPTTGFADASITLGRVTPPGTSIGSTLGLNEFVDVELTGSQAAANYNFGEILTAVTKQFFLSRNNVAQQMANLLTAR